MKALELNALKITGEIKRTAPGLEFKAETGKKDLRVKIADQTWRDKEISATTIADRKPKSLIGKLKNLLGLEDYE